MTTTPNQTTREEIGGVFINHHDVESSLAALWAHYPNLRNEAADAGGEK